MTYTQYGKKLANTSQVWTTKGWKNHGDLKVGDRVFNPKGDAVKVIHIHPKGMCDMEVEFNNGEIIKTHSNHEWLLRNRDVRDKKFRIYETKELVNNFKKYQVPFIDPIKGVLRKPTLDAYTLGIWLGDGTASAANITNSKEDAEVLVEHIPYKVSNVYVHKKYKTHRVSFGYSGFIDELKKYNLLNNKHIPLSFKLASVKIRRELLAGLIDSDGYVFHQVREGGYIENRVYISSANKLLVDDISDLIHSLGMRRSIVKVKAKDKPNLAGIIGKKDIYQIGFTPLIEIPTKLKRKKIVPKIKYRHVLVKDVRKIKPVEGNCITVEGGMYLVGKTMVPTHNSLVVAIAILTRACIVAEKTAIVAGTGKQAKIVMGYIIEHAYDNELGKVALMIEKGEQYDAIRRERSKEKLTFKTHTGELSEVFVLSGDSRNKQRAGEAVMGFGAKNVVLDEAALIDDEIEAKIFRMLGGRAKNFYCKIGNPFKRNHFHKDFMNQRFWHINVDYKRGIKEGRLNPDFIEEARAKPIFDILYENKFPAADMMDDKMFVPILSEGDLQIIEDSPFMGRKRLGVDPAGEGRDETVIVLRDRFKAKVLRREKVSNPKGIATQIETIMIAEDLKNTDVFVDLFGEGAKVVNELARNGIAVNGVNVGDSCEDPEAKEMYINIRAHSYWLLREWIKSGAQLIKGGDWEELLDIKFKANHARKIQIKSKQDMMRDGIFSPNTADALMVTFAEEWIDYLYNEKTEKEEEFDRFSVT